MVEFHNGETSMKMELLFFKQTPRFYNTKTSPHIHYLTLHLDDSSNRASFTSTIYGRVKGEQLTYTCGINHF